MIRYKSILGAWQVGIRSIPKNERLLSASIYNLVARGFVFKA